MPIPPRQISCDTYRAELGSGVIAMPMTDEEKAAFKAKMAEAKAAKKKPKSKSKAPGATIEAPRPARESQRTPDDDSSEWWW